MLELKTKKQLSVEAFKLAHSLNLVRYRSITYIPADFETRETSVPPDIDRTIWLPLKREDVQKLGADQFDTLFGTDGELASFEFMVAQSAIQMEKEITSLLVRTPHGLMELDDTGALVPATQEFRPNTLAPMLNEDQAEKDRVFGVISEWLDSDVEAVSLLKHLATSLAPGWAAVKYVLLLGEGRNGKGVLLDMLTGLFGRHNVSHVPRQEMSVGSPMVIELNGKLLNLVYDGPADYLKDSGREKSLIAGETVSIKELYKSSPTQVQTTALFIEGLNHEPKTKDKSTALQKRLVRFEFPNVYALNHKFRRGMLTEKALGAFLSLLIDHYVVEDEVSVQLAPTAKAIELQLEQMYSNSIGLQFLKYIEETDPLGVHGLLGAPLGDLVAKFKSWRIKEDDLGSWAEPDVQALFQPLLNTERRTQRVNGQPRKVRIVVSMKIEAVQFVDTLRGEPDDAAHSNTVVAD